MAHILVVEDDVAIRCLLRTMLEFHGYQVYEAANGYEGLQCYQVQPTDLVITDMEMPVMDGTQFLIELRRKFPLAKVVAISGEKRLLERTKTFNIQGAFEKPFRLRDLLLVIQELVNAPSTPEPRYEAAACLTSAT